MKFLIFAITFVFILMPAAPDSAFADWVEERWSDEEGNNYQGRVTPPVRSNPSHSTPRAIPQNTKPDLREAARERYDNTKKKGRKCWERKDYDCASRIWYDALQICKKNRFDDCIELEQRLTAAIAYRDMAEKAEAEKAAAARRRAQARAAAARRKAEMERQRRQAKKNIKSLLKDTAVDFDGTGRGINLSPMMKPAPAVSENRNTQAYVHSDPNTVDLRFMAPEDKRAVPTMRRSVSSPNQKGVRYRDVPLPEALLPDDPAERLAMKGSASHILTSLAAAGGNPRRALDIMEETIRELPDPNNQAAHESYSYLLGLYAANVVLGEGIEVDPFTAKPDDSKALIYAIADKVPAGYEAKNQKAEANVHAAMVSAMKQRRRWVMAALTENDNNREQALRSLMKEKSPAAVLAFRFMQGLNAYLDAKRP